MVAGIARIQSPLNLLLNQTFVITEVLKYFNCDTFPKDLFAILTSWFFLTL
jgi:hypothetical protein